MKQLSAHSKPGKILNDSHVFNSGQPCAPFTDVKTEVC